MIDEGLGKAYLDRYGKGTKGAGWYCLRRARRPLRRAGQRRRPQGGRPRPSRRRPARLAGRRSERQVRLDADRRLRPHPAVDGLCRLGLGHRRRLQALTLLKRFGSVTVLNGHIHQIMQKVEGNMTFHTARSTAFPQPAPGTRNARTDDGAGRAASPAARHLAASRSASATGRSPSPTRPLRPERRSGMDERMRIGHWKLAITLGPRAVLRGKRSDARRLAAATASAADTTVKIANFTSTPQTLTVPAGTTVTWSMTTTSRMSSPRRTEVPLQGARHRRQLRAAFTKAGTIEYFCAMHPHMTGKIVVTP